MVKKERESSHAGCTSQTLAWHENGQNGMQEKNERIVQISFCSRNSLSHMKKYNNNNELYLAKFMPDT